MGSLVSCFADVDDPRNPNARHNLHELLFIVLCTVLRGGEDCSDMAVFGQSREPFLRLKHGIPSHDTFSPVFRLLDPEPFHTAFLRFMQRFADTIQGAVAIARELTAQVTTERACYLLSTRLTAERFGQVARAHWGIENGLHRVLDVTMNENQTRNRHDHGPQNIALLRRIALNFAKLEGSIQGKIKKAGWDSAFLTRLLARLTQLQMRQP